MNILNDLFTVHFIFRNVFIYNLVLNLIRDVSIVEDTDVVSVLVFSHIGDLCSAVGLLKCVLIQYFHKRNI